MKSKVHYRPIEAAIRWSGLQRREPEILAALVDRKLPDEIDFPCWPSLRLNTERIYDGILNGDLRYSLDGVVSPESRRVERDEFAKLTVRHIDLRDWMTRCYPGDRPRFLFSQCEREGNPTAIEINLHIDSGDAGPLAKPSKRNDICRRRDLPSSASGLSPRSETTYLHIVGGLLSVLLGESPSGRPYSSFRTQESIISALVAHHGERLGITERTLQQKFAAAKRALTRG